MGNNETPGIINPAVQCLLLNPMYLLRQPHKLFRITYNCYSLRGVYK